ncbi:hypothetical protein OBBRIDRAFT_814425 [Obba rivulosa]|uniref:Alpha/beta hydrolase fold-3 domain-containing protein n=1 Tax=Obba rivulosa TaxID=1052685 RepID=A0A8E2AP08_9APHY|nr:hypothetical protein OBBRIDRAFT_814425 [Obba rivulosa]
MPIAFRHQPLKAIYTTDSILYLLCFLPVWTIVGLVPAFRPRCSWTLKRTLIVKSYRLLLGMMFNTAIIAPEPQDKYALIACESGFVWVDATPNLVVGEICDKAQINGVKAEKTCGFWWGPRGPGRELGQRASEGEKVVYHMHAHPSNSPVVTCLNGFLEHFGHNLRIFTIEHRKSSGPPFSPANPFPAALLDAIAGYRYLVEDVGFEPKNIIVEGDSAGGRLAFDLVLYLAITKPSGLLLLSLTVDWAVTQLGSDSAMVRNDSADFMQDFYSRYTRRALLSKLPDQFLRLQKAPGAWSRLPRTCIVTGDAEISVDAMRTLRDSIQEEDSSHDPFAVEWFEPERAKGLRQLGEWAQKVWAV